MPYFKGRSRQPSIRSVFGYAFLAWAIVLALLVFFLSSGRPAWSKQYAGEPHLADTQQVYIEPVRVFVPPAPIPYARFDTSKMLDGWYDMFAVQLALNSIIEMEEYEQRMKEADERIQRQIDINEWRKDNSNWLLAAIIGFLIITSFGLVYSAQKEYWGGKR